MIMNYKGVWGALEVNQSCHDCSDYYTFLKCLCVCSRVCGVVFPGVHGHMCDVCVWRLKDNLCHLRNTVYLL